MQTVGGIKSSRSIIWACQKRFGGGFVPSDMPIIKRKWGAVEKVEKITTTMRNVAAGKLPSCEKFLKGIRPFCKSFDDVLTVNEEPKDVKKVLHVAVGVERGLCGAVSSGTPRKIHEIIEEDRSDTQHEVVAFGKITYTKIAALLPNHITYGFTEIKTKQPTFATALRCVEVMDGAHQYDKSVYYYNYYQNTVTFPRKEYHLYNKEISQGIADEQYPDYDLEGDEATIFDNFYEFKQASILYSAMVENLTSEMGNRLASMDGASKTCKEKAVEYESIYQGLRKTKITNELTILSVGAKLSKAKK